MPICCSASAMLATTATLPGPPARCIRRRTADGAVEPLCCADHGQQLPTPCTSSPCDTFQPWVRWHSQSSRVQELWCRQSRRSDCQPTMSLNGGSGSTPAASQATARSQPSCSQKRRRSAGRDKPLVGLLACQHVVQQGHTASRCGGSHVSVAV